MLLLGVLLTLLPFAVYAAPFGSGFKDMPTSAWILTLVLSTLAGMVALLNRIREELRQHGALTWGGLFVSAHMLGSWLAGLLMFLISIGMGWSESVTAIAIISASFAGAVFIEKMAVKWLWRSFGVNVSGPAPFDQKPADRNFRPVQEMATPPERRKKKPPITAPRRADFVDATDSAPIDGE